MDIQIRIGKERSRVLVVHLEITIILLQPFYSTHFTKQESVLGCCRLQEIVSN
ncbi:hypothetical protein Mapa_013163 [Marchantia paleacea]|nr:hypothetical protein Mapa_013163 [Marchantia paleacea]